MTDPMPTPMPPALRDALALRPDGAELDAVWRALPVPEPVPADEASRMWRDLAWRQLTERILDPSRVPSREVDEPAPFSLITGVSDAEVSDETMRGQTVTRASAPTTLRPAVQPSLPTSTKVRSLTNHNADINGLRTNRQRSFRLVWSAAATLLVALGGTAAWQATPQHLTVAAGAAPKTLTLSDGSRVTLAPGAELRMPRGFRHWFGAEKSTRIVQLAGQAFFDIARDGRPFAVETDDATVRVLGTHFDVRSASAFVGTRVVVEEGRVSVQGRAQATPLTLTAGDAAVITTGGSAQPLPPLNVERATSWRTGGLAAIDEPLGNVLAELARRAGVEIALDRDVPADATVTLFYATTPSTERMLADLSAARALHYTRTSRGFLVSAGSANR